MASPEEGNSSNSTWFFDYCLIDDLPVSRGELPSLGTGIFWPQQHLTGPSNLREFDDSLENSNSLRENVSRKRMRTGSCNETASKACKEKLRRDRLNDRFLELGSILEPGRLYKMDKGAILTDAVRILTQLRDETQKLKESNKDLQEKIDELKAEKNELRDEKQRLKEEKEKVEQQVKAFKNTPPGFMPPFSAQEGHIFGSKMVPFMGYPSIPMWQFMPPTAIDTSQDQALHPPVA